MKVNPIYPEVMFGAIPVGGIFWYMDEFFMKVSYEKSLKINAISTDGNHVCTFNNTELVTYYPNASLNLI